MKPFGYDDYKELLESFTAQVKDATGDNLISTVLYGSVARGAARLESDLDLLIILREAPDSYYERLGPFLGILKQMTKESAWLALQARGVMPYISLLILARKEAGHHHYIFLDMIKDGKVLFDQGGFFGARLKALDERLQELGSKKIYLEDGIARLAAWLTEHKARLHV